MLACTRKTASSHYGNVGRPERHKMPRRVEKSGSACRRQHEQRWVRGKDEPRYHHASNTSYGM